MEQKAIYNLDQEFLSYEEMDDAALLDQHEQEQNNLANYEKEKKYRDACDSQLKLIQLNREIYKREKDNRLHELKEKYEVKQKSSLFRQQQKHHQILEQKNNELQEVLRSQKELELHLKSLQNQLNPHFIFATLQNIQAWIIKEKAVVASDYLAQFASFMRSILNASRKSTIILKDEIKLIDTYLKLAQKRNKGINFVIEADKELDEDQLELPSFLVQPFVEKVLMECSDGPFENRVRVVFRQSKEVLYVHILSTTRLAEWKNESVELEKNIEALRIIDERAKLSISSKKFHFKYRVWDRIVRENIRSTHVLLMIKKLKHD